MFKNALVSCSDKTGLVEFLKPFAAKGMRIVSTGGTAKILREAGLKVVDVSEQTGFPEVMDGRVKTLHPRVHMALLGRTDHDGDMGTLRENDLQPFDLVVGNLYPFEAEPSVETIDIGGPSFLRAAAKNFNSITVICDPADYEWLSNKDNVSLEDRQKLAAKVFAHTGSYDAMICRHFAGDSLTEFNDGVFGGRFHSGLRYGENPQQKAVWWRMKGEETGLHSARILQGKELSYNNILDTDAAIRTLRDLGPRPACVAVKHNSPCGAATADDMETAVDRALKSDPVSVFGGIVALNRPLSGKAAELLKDIFLECIVAPEVSPEATDILSAKKNLRLMEWKDMLKKPSHLNVRTVSGGLLVQAADSVETSWSSDWEIIGEKPSEKIRDDLLLAWSVCANLKSNAIAVAGNGQTLGLGMGQVNRVDAVELAISRYQRFHPQTETPVLASDAFFPFPDSIDRIAETNIRYVIQPGGSMRDEAVIKAAKNQGITLIMTKTRHFLH